MRYNEGLKHMAGTVRQPVGETKAEKSNAVEMLSFGGAQFAASTFMAFLSYYLMMFFTDVALIPPAATAVLMLCFRLFSALSTQGVGLFINRTRFKDGKYRPYLKWCALPFAVGLSALGLTPRLGASGMIIYVSIALIICDLSWSAIQTATMSMLPYLAGDDMSRSRFTSFSNGSAIIAYIIIGSFMLPLADFLGKNDRSKGFAATLALLAVIALPLFFNAYFRLKERHYIETKSKPAIKDIFLIIGRSKRILLFMGGFCLYSMADTFKNLTAYYYMTHIMKQQDMLPVVIMAGLISPLLMQPVIPRLLKFAKKESLIVFGLFAAGFSGLLMFWAGPRLYALIICIVLYGVSTSVVANLVYAVMASFSDEIRLGQNISMSEILTTTMNLSSNIGNAAAGGAAAMLMAVSGYSAQAAAQSAGALTGIKALYIFCTAAGMVLAGGVMMLFRRNARPTQPEHQASRQWI